MSNKETRNLINSVVMGETEAFKNLLKDKKCDIDGFDPDSEMNALGYAVAAGRIDFVKELLNAGASATLLYEGGASVLTYAGNCLFFDKSQFSNVINIVELLVEAGADINLPNEENETPLMEAVENPEYLEILMQHGADINAKDGFGKSVLVRANEIGVQKSIDALVAARAADDGSDLYEFEQAAVTNNIKKIGEMINDGFDITSIAAGNALSVAATQGYEEMVRLLLEAEVDVNARHDGDVNYFTPLIDAAYGSHPRIVEMLLDAGANPELEVENVGNALAYAKLGKKENNRPDGEWDKTIEILREVAKGKSNKRKNRITKLGYELTEDFGGNFDVLLVKGNEEEIAKLAEESGADDRVAAIFDTGWHSVYGRKTEAIQFSKDLEAEVIYYYFGDASGDLGYSLYSNGTEIEHYSLGEYFEETEGSDYLAGMDTIFVDEETETQYRFKSSIREATEKEIRDSRKFIDSFLKSKKTYLGDEALP